MANLTTAGAVAAYLGVTLTTPQTTEATALLPAVDAARLEDDVAPAAAAPNLPDGVLRYPEPAGYLALRHSAYGDGTDRPHLSLGEFGRVVCLARSRAMADGGADKPLRAHIDTMPALRAHVMHVVCIGAEPEMSEPGAHDAINHIGALIVIPHTAGMIACMQDQPGRGRGLASSELPGQPVGIHADTFGRVNNSIAGSSAASEPKPTLVSRAAGDAAPKARNDMRGNLNHGRHAPQRRYHTHYTLGGA